MSSATASRGVAVTGLQNSDRPSAGVECARGLRETGAERIVGLVEGPHETGAYLDDLFDALAVLPWNGDARNWIDSLARRREDLDFDVLLPGTREHVERLAPHVDELEHRGIRTLLPPPETLEWCCVSRLEELTERVGLGTVRAARAPAGAEYAATALVDDAQQIVGYCAIRVLESDDQGSVWLATSILGHDLREELARIVRGLGWRGFLTVRAVRAAGAESLRIIRLTPRPPTWASLARAAGQPLEAAYVRLARGAESPCHEPPAAGLLLVRTCREETTHIREFARLLCEGESHHVESP